MSASREKKKRQNQPEVSAVDSKKGCSKGLKRVLTTVIAILLVVAVVFLGMVSTSFFQKHITVAEANGNKLTAAQINFYYAAAYNATQSSMGSMIDPEIPLNQQNYGGEENYSWADYLMDMAVSGAAESYAIYDEAIAAGYELPEDEKAALDSELQMLSAYAAMYGYSSVDAFIAAQYGPGCTLKGYEEYMHINALASSYANSTAEALTYTQEDLDAYYAEHSEDFDSVTFRVFSVSPDLFPEETDKEAALKLCEEAAKNMAALSQNNEDAFLAEALELTLDDDAETFEPANATLRQANTLSSCNETYRAWLADAARQEGDATYIANGESGYNVLYFVRMEDMSFQLPNVRHILISVTDTEDEAAKTEAAEKAQTVLDEFLAGEQTEEAFAELAKQYSMDNAEDGGLYENIVPGYMVESFENWCYDSERQIGDTGIVESTYGYHVMYFSGFGKTFLNNALENVLRQNQYDLWFEEMTADAEYTVSDLAKRLVVKF